MDDFDLIPAFLMAIFGIILGIFIGHFIENKYDNCFSKNGYVYCEKMNNPEDIKRIGILKGENNVLQK